MNKLENTTKDHRKYIYQLSKSKLISHPNKHKIGKEEWSVIQWKNVLPPGIVNLWAFETKEEAESFMKKNNFVIYEKQLKEKNSRLEVGNTYEIIYVNMSGWTSKREITIRSVDQKYVKAYDHIYCEVKTFRKDRIKSSRRK